MVSLAPVVQVLVGVMITSKVTPQHRHTMRQAVSAAKSCDCNVDMLFFTGAGGDFAVESVQHGDIVQLGFEENMNRGKTFRWFAHAYQRLYIDRTSHADYVFKMDTDTSVDWCGLCQVAATHRRNQFLYIGRQNTRRICDESSTRVLCPPEGCVDFENGCWTYMSGGFYGMSSLLVKKVIESPYSYRHAHGPEDMQVGLWIREAYRATRVLNVPNGKLWCHWSPFGRDYPTGPNFRQRWTDCEK